jgi:RNA recognition motif-containing protein
MSVRIYVGNLPRDLEREELEALFAEAGDSVSAKLVTDRKTGKCRGFAFVTVQTDEQADALIEKFNGLTVKDSAIKLEKANPRDAKAPTNEAPSRRSNAASSNSGSGNSTRKSSNKGSRVISSDPIDAAQPDPRWAQELEKLKALLSAQGAAS